MALTDELAGLATMSPSQLRAEWRRVYRSSPPRLTPDLLRHGIAYRLQERVHGGLPAASLRQLVRHARQLATGEARVGAPAVRLKPGTRLVRGWQGTTYSVLVTDDGFLLGERRFASLSQVAQAITGAHWSGPRFFAVKAGSTTTGAAATSATRARSAAVAAAGKTVGPAATGAMNVVR